MNNFSLIIDPFAAECIFECTLYGVQCTQSGLIIVGEISCRLAHPARW